MRFSTRASAEGVYLTLNGECTIENALELKRIMTDALNTSRGLTINVGDTTAADLSFLQLLCWAHQTSVSANKFFRLDSDQAAPFGEAIKEAGFERPLGCRREFHRTCLWTTAAGGQL